MTRKLTPAFVREILKQRNTPQGIYSLKDLPQPDLLKGSKESARLVAETMRENGNILVVGDYDADGVNASALMYKFFSALGYKNFEVVIPNRFSDGYGISTKLLERLEANKKFQLVISVDNGISAYDAGEFCAKENLKLIITDHHTPQDSLPKANALINPKQPGCEFPFKDICGCVVAWYLCASIKQEIGADIHMGEFLPFLALATLADVMPLVGVNRILVKKGLDSIKKSNMPMCEIIRQKLKIMNAENVSFHFIPLLNCAGRMADANKALEFLLAPDIQRAKELYKDLESINNERKIVQEEILRSAKNVLTQKDNLLYASYKDWHKGVLGIICSQLVQTYKKSAFVLSDDGHGILKGSARSYGNVDLIKTAQNIQAKHSLLLDFGGHQGALGLSLESKNLEKFMQLFDENLQTKEEIQSAVLGEIPSCYINKDLLQILEEFEPFGQANPIPCFACNDLELVQFKIIGKDKNHLQLAFLNTQKMHLGGVEFFYKQLPELGTKNWEFSLSRDMFYDLCLKIHRN